MRRSFPSSGDKKHKAELATEGVSFEQAQIAVQDAAGYEKAKSLITSALSQANGREVLEEREERRLQDPRF
jgi:hypothetical protein